MLAKDEGLQLDIHIQDVPPLIAKNGEALLSVTTYFVDVLLYTLTSNDRSRITLDMIIQRRSPTYTA